MRRSKRTYAQLHLISVLPLPRVPLLLLLRCLAAAAAVNV
jgi:hypothetical protein